MRKNPSLTRPGPASPQPLAQGRLNDSPSLGRKCTTLNGWPVGAGVMWHSNQRRGELAAFRDLRRARKNEPHFSTELMLHREGHTAAVSTELFDLSEQQHAAASAVL